MSRTLPMFPLGSVLVPTALLPLHVFEPRYRALVADILDGDSEFGVVLIDRGQEVGGGDVRTHLGTIARVVQAEEFDDGRWAVISAGTRRIRVAEWLEDAPYPRAVVEELDDTPGEDAAAAREEAVAALRRVLALAAELGADTPPATVDVADDPVTASFNVLALSPLGPLDRQRLLGAVDAATRLRDLAAALAEVEQDLRGQLTLGDVGPVTLASLGLDTGDDESDGSVDDATDATDGDDRDEPPADEDEP